METTPHLSTNVQGPIDTQENGKDVLPLHCNTSHKSVAEELPFFCPEAPVEVPEPCTPSSAVPAEPAELPLQSPANLEPIPGAVPDLASTEGSNISETNGRKHSLDLSKPVDLKHEARSLEVQGDAPCSSAEETLKQLPVSQQVANVVGEVKSLLTAALPQADEPKKKGAELKPDIPFLEVEAKVMLNINEAMPSPSSKKTDDDLSSSVAHQEESVPAARLSVGSVTAPLDGLEAESSVLEKGLEGLSSSASAVAEPSSASHDALGGQQVSFEVMAPLSPRPQKTSEEIPVLKDDFLDVRERSANMDVLVKASQTTEDKPIAAEGEVFIEDKTNPAEGERSNERQLTACPESPSSPHKTDEKLPALKGDNSEVKERSANVDILLRASPAPEDKSPRAKGEASGAQQATAKQEPSLPAQGNVDTRDVAETEVHGKSASERLFSASGGDECAEQASHANITTAVAPPSGADGAMPLPLGTHEIVPVGDAVSPVAAPVGNKASFDIGGEDLAAKRNDCSSESSVDEASTMSTTPVPIISEAPRAANGDIEPSTCVGLTASITALATSVNEIVQDVATPVLSQSESQPAAVDESVHTKEEAAAITTPLIRTPTNEVNSDGAECSFGAAVQASDSSSTVSAPITPADASRQPGAEASPDVGIQKIAICKATPSVTSQLSDRSACHSVYQSTPAPPRADYSARSAAPVKPQSKVVYESIAAPSKADTGALRPSTPRVETRTVFESSPAKSVATARAVDPAPLKGLSANSATMFESSPAKSTADSGYAMAAVVNTRTNGKVIYESVQAKSKADVAWNSTPGPRLPTKSEFTNSPAQSTAASKWNSPLPLGTNAAISIPCLIPVSPLLGAKSSPRRDSSESGSPAEATSPVTTAGGEDSTANLEICTTESNASDEIERWSSEKKAAAEILAKVQEQTRPEAVGVFDTTQGTT